MADPNVAVAATFVASVLEHAGYLTQARFLQEFQGFFRDAGALIYALAGAGAVVSVAMYGSTRAVQYFLIGPALFWFLVGPTTTTEGVKWKLGGGNYLGMLREQGEQASGDFRDQVLKKVNEKSGGANIEVAIGFWLFARPINEFVNEFVDILLAKESTEDLTAQQKIQGLELIATMLPYEADHLHHIEEFSTQCNKFFGAANSAAEIQARTRARKVAERNGGKVNGDTTSEAFKTYKDRMIKYGKSDTIDPANSGFLNLVRWMAKSEAAADNAKGQAAVKLAKDLLPEVEAGAHLECKDAWTLLAAETWFRAKADVPRVLRTASGYWEYQAAREYTCKELTRKTLDDEDAECDLAPAVAMFTLYNHWKNLDTHQRMVGRHRNGKDFTNPKADTILTGPMQRGFVPVTIPGAGGVQTIRRQSFNAQGQSYIEQLVYNPNLTMEANVGMDDKVRYMWMPIVPITQLRGSDHAMNVASRQFETTRLKQQIVSYAMQLPYYQGVCLYMIAIAYPFLALIVLLPGRAQNFLVVPLAWLWVKSWDIGFATVIVLDKVMYNLLPSWTLDENLRAGPWTEQENLIDVIAQGFFFDPWTSIHNYYAIMAMVTLGIPALSGAIILKAKKGVLSSFTDAPASQSKDRADKAASGFSVQAQSERNHMMMQVKGLSLMMAHGGAGQIDLGSRGGASTLLAVMQTGIDGVSRADLQKIAQGDPTAIAKLPEQSAVAMEKYLAAYTKNALAYAPFASSLSARFDGNTGRAGIIQHMEEAYAAAMDSGGVYEISGSTENAVNEMLGLMSTQADASLVAYGKGAKLLGKGVDATVNDPIAGTVLASAAVLGYNAVAGEQIDLDWLRNKSGAGGSTNEEFLALSFSMDRFSYSTPELKREVAKLEKYFQAEHFNDAVAPLMRDIHEVLTGQNTRGGPSNIIELYINATGPDKFWDSKPALGKDETTITPDQLASMLPRVDEDAVEQAAKRIGGVASTLLGHEKVTPGSELEMQIGSGAALFMNMTEARENDLNARLASEWFMLRGGQAQWHEDQKERAMSDIVSYLGGAEKVVSYWNTASGGAPLEGHKLTYEEGVGLRFESGEEFSARDHVFLIQHQSGNEGYVKQRRDELVASFGGTGDTPEAREASLDPYDLMQIEMMGDYHKLQSFKYGGKSKDLVQLMEVSPLVSLQIAKDWAAAQKGIPSTESVGFAPDASVMTTSGEYFKKPEDHYKKSGDYSKK